VLARFLTGQDQRWLWIPATALHCASLRVIQNVWMYGPTMMTMMMMIMQPFNVDTSLLCQCVLAWPWTFLAKFWSARILQAWCNASIRRWKVGRTTLNPPSTWTVTHDSGVGAQTTWGYVTWTASMPSDSTLTVLANGHITHGFGFVGARQTLFASTSYLPALHDDGETKRQCSTINHLVTDVSWFLKVGCKASVKHCCQKDSENYWWVDGQSTAI